MAAIIGGVGYGVYYGVKKYQKRRDNKKQAAEMQLQSNTAFSVADPSFEILSRQSIPSKRPLAVPSPPSYYSESVYSQASSTLTQDRHNSPTFTQFLDNQASSHPPSYENSVSSTSTPRSSTPTAAAPHSHSSDCSSDEDDDPSNSTLSLLPTPLHLYHESSPPTMPQRSPYRSSRMTSNIRTQMAELDSTTPVSATSPHASSGYSHRAELADTSPVSPTAPDVAIGTSPRRAPKRSSLRRYEVL